MRIKLFAFIKPSMSATMFSHKIANYLSEQLETPVLWDDDIANGNTDLLIIVGGGMPFCRHLEPLAKAVLNADKVVYCTNDYRTTKLPTEFNRAKSSFRASFRLRAKRGMSKPLLWSTLEDEADQFINWNLLAWDPDFIWSPTNPQSLIYYGSWRPRRLEVLDLFLSKPMVYTVVSNNTDRPKKRWPLCQHISSLTPNIVENLGQFGLGLYTSDARHTREPPSCRFYEMLSAGLPIVFHRPIVEMLANYGLQVDEEMIVDDATSIPKAMKNRIHIAKRQRKWIKDYHLEIDRQLRKAIKCL